MRRFERDSGGQPVFATALVLFLDVLGATDMAGSTNAPQHLAALDAALAEARRLSQDDLEEPWLVSAWFSDNLALAARIVTDDGEPEFGAFLTAAGAVQLHLALQGFFTRGGIAIGEHFMDDNITFGPALAEAVSLEKSAVYPRILLGGDVMRLVETHLGYYGDPEYSPQHGGLFVDVGGDVFVNYLNHVLNFVESDIREASSLIEQHRDRITERLELHVDQPRVWEKYAWASEYHNAFCHHYGVPELTVPDAVSRVTFEGVGAAHRSRAAKRAKEEKTEQAS